ncbi:inactive LRR receptor-like serine/threonine-protein kinase BIR2 [Triticum dicoccoides]|uniref:inactive LRR receptor-like serine/threonine-protein kinase BIR2 n=1 Tax=Triticum dicoccoides TaxID=85692 RepID=UPI001890C5F2|nr:inactive LRR receptor-like serine/threonine-protein kinase BIR2 [Triticum dicoccoides]
MSDCMKKSLLWLLLLSCCSTPCSGSGDEPDVRCLKSFLRSVVDPGGALKSSWNFNNATKGYICGFTGVTCWSADQHRVWSLRLSGVGLQGPFPRGLQDCANMTGTLDLSSNSFAGPIPADISQQLPFVTSLNLSYNGFRGPIPPGMGKMGEFLAHVDLGHNQLSGQVPLELSRLRFLASMNVANNSLSGPIPAFLQGFPAASFAGNDGLCGAPLDRRCPASARSRMQISGESSVGAAVGFVLGFAVAFYFPQWFSRRLHPYVYRFL